MYTVEMFQSFGIEKWQVMETLCCQHLILRRRSHLSNLCIKLLNNGNHHHITFAECLIYIGHSTYIMPINLY